MVKKVIITIFVCLFILQVASAATTNLDIKTLKNHEINIQILNPDKSSEAYQTYLEKSGPFGIVSITFTDSVDKFDLKIFVSDTSSGFSELVMNDAFSEVENGKDYCVILDSLDSSDIIEDCEFDSTGNQIDLSIPEETEINETENLTEPEVPETTEEDANKSSGFLGLAIFGEDSFFKKKGLKIFLYIIGGIALLIVAYFGIKYLRKRKPRGYRKIKVRKLSELKNKKEDNKEDVEDYQEAIKNAEKKIEEAQKQLDSLKKEDKITELKKKILENQEELEKLKGD